MPYKDPEKKKQWQREHPNHGEDARKERYHADPVYRAARNAASREWYKNNPLNNKANKLRRHYNLTLDDWNVMLESQGGGCVICGDSENLTVDHDHGCCPGNKSCGKCVRGLLCRRHNFAFGNVRDSVSELQAMVLYLSAQGVN